ncbi:MAG: hypothetical protein EOM20_05755 [Spartobacteria bacterium]|nr:hypothetical protein [Spartobacteria bacterium]
MITQPVTRRRALGLLSGSLDSYTAFHLMRQQPVTVDALVFTSPFFDTAKAVEASRSLGVNLFTQDITVQMVKALKGWDPEEMHICDMAMLTILREARCFMEAQRYDFVFSGEVVRQHSDQVTPERISRMAGEAGFDGDLVLPLSARELPQTRPEAEGWITPAFFGDVSGRARHYQKRVAEELDIRDVVSARNTGRLRDPVFRGRVLDLLAHGALAGSNHLRLLHIGRHFRLDRDIKLVLGRNEQENMEIEGSAELYDLLLRLRDRRGPTGLLPYTATDQHVKTAAAICARYGDVPQQTAVHVRIRSPRQAQDIAVEPARREFIESFRI